MKLFGPNRAFEQLNQIHEYIKKDSPKGAEKVVKSIVKRVQTLSIHAMLYEADRFKRRNDGSYRATTIYKFRIIYRITTDQVIILKILHAARLPKKY